MPAMEPSSSGPCESNPCANNGTCTVFKNAKFKCVCLANYTGKQCQFGM